MNAISKAEAQAVSLINSAAAQAFPEAAELPAFSVEKPANAAFGDLSVNAAMVWARALHASPRDIAAKLIDKSDLSDTFFDTITVAGAGFINFTYSPAFFRAVLAEALTQGAGYGRSERMKGLKIMVEFVSANPTGPMHIGNARGGAAGDVLAELLSRCGAEVTREFYVNDSGNQIERFGLSLEARYLQHFGQDVPVPEDGYHGDDITARAGEYIALHGDDVLTAEPQLRRDALVAYALEKNIDLIRETLHGYRIDYDVWFRESSLYRDKITDKVISILTEKGLTYEKDGALWYAASRHSPEECPEDKRLKDEVLIRTNGNCTYFAADAAYHYNKFALRGFDKVVNVWGADHHGHIARLKYILDDLGLNGSENLEVVLIQLVRLMQDVQAHRQGDIAFRPARRDLRRRGALLLQYEDAGDGHGFRPRPRDRAVGAEPDILRAVRARAHMQSARHPRGRRLRPRGRRSPRGGRTDQPGGKGAADAARGVPDRYLRRRGEPRSVRRHPLRDAARVRVPQLLQRPPHPQRREGADTPAPRARHGGAAGACQRARHPQGRRAGENVRTI